MARMKPIIVEIWLKDGSRVVPWRLRTVAFLARCFGVPVEITARSVEDD